MEYKTLIKFLFLAVIFTFIICPFFAQAKSLEIDYPTLSGSAPAPQSTKTLLPDYIKYLFSFSLKVAGIVCFLSLFYGGFLYVSSVGKPGQLDEANQQILNSVYGLIIILASYLLLNTINPEMIILKGPQIKSGNMGIVVYDSDNCGGGSGTGEYNFLHLYSNTTFGDKTLCSTNDCDDDMKGQKDYWINHVKSIKFLNDPNEMKIKYSLQPKPDDLIPITFQKNECKTISFSDLKKITFIYNLPGVYLYKDDNCEDEFLYSTVSTSGFPTKPVDWVNKVKCVKIVNTKESRFVAVLHENSNYKGKCVAIVGTKDPDPNNPEIYKLSSENSNKLANIKNSFAQAAVNPNFYFYKPETTIPPVGSTGNGTTNEPAEGSTNNQQQSQPFPTPPLISPSKQTTVPISVPTSASGGTSTQTTYNFKEMADSLTVFEIPKQKRNDGSDQGVTLFDNAVFDKPILKFLSGYDDKGIKVVYYDFNSGNLTFYDCKEKGDCPTEDKTSAIDTELKTKCNSTCVGIRNLFSIEKPCLPLDPKNCLEINDRTTSLKVSPGYVAILWEEYDYNGQCEVFTDEVSDLSGHNMGKCFNYLGLGSSDCTSSIKVFQKK
jgi:hypothetical protein